MLAPSSNDMHKHIIATKLKDIPEAQIAADKAIHKGILGWFRKNKCHI